MQEVTLRIKKIMLEQGLSYDDLAIMTGYSCEHLSRVVNCHLDSPKVKKVIALALGDVNIWD